MTEEEKPERRWVLFGIPLCLAMGFFELERAIKGNHRSWLYTFEWPFFALFIYYMWWKLKQPQPDWDDTDDPKRELED